MAGELGAADALFRLFDEAQRQRLCGNIAAAMDGVPAGIVERQLEPFREVDPACAEGVAKALAARGRGWGAAPGPAPRGQPAGFA